jgi:hypothetical protein
MSTLKVVRCVNVHYVCVNYAIFNVDPTGRIPGYIRLFVGGVDANVLGSLNAPVDDAAEIHVVIGTSGG